MTSALVSTSDRRAYALDNSQIDTVLDAFARNSVPGNRLGIRFKAQLCAIPPTQRTVFRIETLLPTVVTVPSCFRLSGPGFREKGGNQAPLRLRPLLSVLVLVLSYWQKTSLGKTQFDCITDFKSDQNVCSYSSK